MLTSFAQDTFTDTSGTALTSHTPDSGGSWTRLTESTASSGSIISNANRLRNQGVANWNGYYHSASPASADYDVAYTSRPVNSSGTPTGVIGRVDTSTEDFYYATSKVDTGLHELGKYVSGTFTALGSGTSTIQTGADHSDRLIMRGDFLAIVVKGGVAAYAQDTAITAAGKAGLYLTGSMTDAAGTHIDTWEAFDCGQLDIRSFSTGNGSSSTMTATLPPNTEEGDLMVVTFRMSSQTITVDSVPSGWTLRQETAMSTASAGWIRTYDKVAGASEAASWDWTLSSSTSWRFYVHTYIGEGTYDTTAETSTAFGTNSTTSTPTATAAEDESLIHFAFGMGAAASTSSSALTTYPTDMATVQTPPGSPYMSAGWSRLASAGTTTAATWSRPGAATSGAQHIVVYSPVTSVDATGTVTAQNIAVGGSTVTGSDATDATGTVSAQNIAVTGASVTGTAGTSATGTVTGDTIPVTGGTILATDTWEYLGQDSVINAIGYAAARAIRQLTEWDGVIWLGHGDIANPSRPLRSRYWDPSDSSFHTTSDRTGGYDTDGLNTHFVYGTDLWLPFNDVTSTGDYAVLSDKDTSSVLARASMDVEHLWWMTEFGGDLYAAGSDNGGGYAAVIWKSTDDGATWSEVFRPEITDGYWFTIIFELNGELWTQAYDALGGVAAGNAHSSTDGSTWNDEGFKFAATNSPIHKVVPFGSVMLLRATPTTSNSGKLLVFDGTAQATDVTASIATETGIQGPLAKDVSVLGDVAYALGTNRVSISLDGTTWGVTVVLPSSQTGSSVLATEGWIYVGTTTSTLWRVPNPVGYVTGSAVPVAGGTVTSGTDVTGTVTAQAIPVSGGSVSATAGAADTGTVSAQAIPITGASVSATAGIGATGTVSAQNIAVTGASVTGTSGETGTVSAQAIPLGYGTISATAGIGDTGTVSASAITITGGTVTGSAGTTVDATGTVSAQAIALGYGLVSATAGAGATGTVTGSAVTLGYGTVSGSAVVSATGTVTVGTVTMAYGMVVASAGIGATGTVSAQAIAIAGGTVTGTGLGAGVGGLVAYVHLAPTLRAKVSLSSTLTADVHLSPTLTADVHLSA